MQKGLSFMEKEQFCLNGYWDFSIAPDPNDFSVHPSEYASSKILVPSPFNINSFQELQKIDWNGDELIIRGGETDLFPEYPSEWASATAGFYKRSIFIPKEWADKKITLQFDAVLFYSECFINGKRVYCNDDGFLPFEFEINDYVVFGQENELLLGAKTASHLYTISETGKAWREYPCGSFWGARMAGIWQDVFLNVYPRTHISDLFITTDVDHHTCDLEITSELTRSDMTLRFSVQNCKTGKTFDFGSCFAAPGQITGYRFDYSAYQDDILLWSMEEPNLYYLKAELLDADGALLDTAQTRFGFRTVHIEGKKLYLNGNPIALKNDSWHYLGFVYQNEAYARKWYEMEKKAHVNVIRLHAQPYPELFVNVADEMGMLIIDESAIWASHCSFRQTDKFIENGKKHVERLIKRDRNHPSVFCWSIENECLMAYEFSRDSAVKDKEELIAKLSTIAEHARQFDRSRILSADGSGDLGGATDVYCVHYPGDNAPVEIDKPITIGEMGNMYHAYPSMANDYIGEKAFLSQHNRLDNMGEEVFELLKHHRKWASQICVFNLVWYGLVPLRYRERMVHYDDYAAPGVKISKIGEYMTTLNAGYDPDLPDYITNPLYDWVKKAYIPERTFFEEEQRAFYRQQDAVMKISVHNDSYQAKDYTVSYSLKADGKAVYENQLPASVEAAEFCYLDLTLPFTALKNSAAIAKYDLELSLSCQGTVIFTDQTPIKVFDLASMTEKARAYRMAVLGTGLETLPRFEKGGNFDVVVLTASVSDEKYKELIGQGLSVIDLASNDPAARMCLKKQNFARGFLDDGFDTALENQDLRALDGSLFAQKYYAREFQENNLPLISSGNGDPLVVELVSRTNGYIASALPLDREDQPLGMQLLLDLAKRLHGEKKRLSSCVVISKENSSFVKALNDMGAAYTLIDRDDRAAIKGLQGVETLLLDGTDDLRFLEEMTANQVQNVHVMNLTNAHIPAQLLGRIDILDRKRYQFVRTGSDEITRGFLNSDLYHADLVTDAPICTAPIFIHDTMRVSGLLQTPSIDWRYWNRVSEDRKTVSLMRSELAKNPEEFLLCRTVLNAMQLYILQIDPADLNEKTKYLFGKYLTNIGVLYHAKSVLELLEDPVYNGKILQHRICESNETELNTDGTVILHSDKTVLKAGIYNHVIEVVSPQDRSDLLLNPDLIFMHYQSSFPSAVYLNGKLIAKGTEIEVNGLTLNSGKNTLLIKQFRDKDSDALFDLTFSRKGNKALDLTYLCS